MTTQASMDLDKVTQQLSNICDSEMLHYGTTSLPFPSNERLLEIINLCRSLLFPGYYGMSIIDADSLKYHIGVDVSVLHDKLTKQIAAGLAFSAKDRERSQTVLWEEACHKASLFVAQLPELRQLLSTDVMAHYRNDPAAHNQGEVILCYPGMKAITNYRIAHKLVELDVPLIPRMITELAHSETAIDIHPEAQIGESFAIDHGTGVVIGATCILGRNVMIYQGVTLGAKNFPQNEDGSLVKGIARHPILGDNVIVYANATILGRVHIGANSVIGGNIWLTHSVPENTRLFYSEKRQVDK